jgi:hypothetical protein
MGQNVVNRPMFAGNQPEDSRPALGENTNLRQKDERAEKHPVRSV